MISRGESFKWNCRAVFVQRTEVGLYSFANVIECFIVGIALSVTARKLRAKGVETSPTIFVLVVLYYHIYDIRLHN